MKRQISVQEILFDVDRVSYAFIDLMHRTHVLNYWDHEIKQDDPFTPFLRVTNSFNGARALRFDIGFMRKHCSYRKELGSNAYAVFNTLTDIAARPPDSPYYQKDRDTIEKRAGRWLKELARHSGEPEFKLDAWIPSWDTDTERERPNARLN